MHTKDDPGQADPQREVMSSLPRTRPQRRSARRAEVQASPERFNSPERGVPEGTSDAAASRPRLAHGSPPEPKPGEISMGSAVDAVKLPVKVGVLVTLRALDAVARNLRSR